MEIKTVLIANRGEIACRLIQTCKRMGLATVAIHSDVDAVTPHVAMADVAISLGNPKCYLDIDAVVKACKDSNADAVLAGYGFLSENPDFVQALDKNGILFVGPTVDNMAQFALKNKARELAKEVGVPIAPGSPPIADVEEAVAFAEREIGYPLMIKSAAGGGGIGMFRCYTESELRTSFESALRLATSNFGNSSLYIEKYIEHARHIEVQVFGDKRGHVVCLGERECSIQRRYQKIIEETPSMFVTPALRDAMCDTAVRLCEHIKYESAGTVEFVVDSQTGDFYFLEVNTRLQVEHTVTEMVAGIDIVEWMLRLAGNDPEFDLDSYTHAPKGHSIQCRLYAEDPARNFQPCTGMVTSLKLAKKPWVRYDKWIETGTNVTPHYDPLLAKIIVHGRSRPEAINRMLAVLNKTKVGGITSNLDYLGEIVKSVQFRSGEISTSLCSNFEYQSPSAEVIESGMYSTLQNYPGRKGYWRVGVPPSGPMDHLSLRAANRLVGNEETVCGIEMTIVGIGLKFHKASTVAVTGAPVDITLNGEPVPQYTALQIEAGGELKVGKTTTGIRTYLAVAGGFDCPEYLGSQSTFVLGHFGGAQGRGLQKGDMIPLTKNSIYEAPFPRLPEQHIPKWTSEWTIGVMYGPHGAPDFFTDPYMDTFWKATWKVHHNSNRLGVRLIGPKPEWTRADGGEAGLHPSNIHDCEYAIGCVNFTGDHPVILGVDGPSLGGFVCPVTIVTAELWKMGQLLPGDTVKFVRVSFEHAQEMKQDQHDVIESVGLKRCQDYAVSMFDQKAKATEGEFQRGAILMQNEMLMVRAQGDESMLIEYGPMKLDLELRFKVRMFMEWMDAYKQNNPDCGIGEISPGVRSVQLQYTAQLDDVLDIVRQCVYDSTNEDIPCRTIHLPLAFDDKWNEDAVQRYMETVNNNAPYLPSNVDFVARINGLKSRKEVQDIMLNATYMILGLGDVYLNAPCAVPIDPRHRLVTSKYSPTRSFTPEGAVGIGGAYLCIYGMESPGGYQLVARTLPIWSLWKSPPFLFRFFDQIKFYHVTDDELVEQRKEYALGKLSIRIEDTVFKPEEYREMLAENAESIEAFRKRQGEAFKVERQYWMDMGMIGGANEEEDLNMMPETPQVMENSIDAPLAGNVWKIPVDEGQEVKAGQTVAILESMKMEFIVRTDRDGVVKKIVKDCGQFVDAREAILVVE